MIQKTAKCAQDRILNFPNFIYEEELSKGSSFFLLPKCLINEIIMLNFSTLINIIMRIFCLFALVSLSILSCKKDKKTEPPVYVPEKTDYHFIHSGNYDGTDFSLNLSDIDSLYFRQKFNESGLYKNLDYMIHVQGKHLDSIFLTSPNDTIITMDLQFEIAYKIDELNNDATMPPLTAARLASVINNPSFVWNSFNSTSLKNILAVKFQNGSGEGTYFNSENITITATTTGSTIRIVGQADSIPVGSFGPSKYITNYQFDYQFKVQQ